MVLLIPIRKQFGNSQLIMNYQSDRFKKIFRVMQGWMFVHTGPWTKERARALFSGIPKGRVLVLDLYSEKLPIYTAYESYFGQPFIWNMLHNFGGDKNSYDCWREFKSLLHDAIKKTRVIFAEPYLSNPMTKFNNSFFKQNL